VIATIGDRLRTNDRILTLQLPFDRGDLLAAAATAKVTSWTLRSATTAC